MPPVLRLGSRTMPLERPLLMGVVNVTPDSFSDGGRFVEPNQALRHAERLVREGADLLDVGAESTRPGATPVPVEEEMRRLAPVLRGCLAFGVPLSVDTYKPEVMREAVGMGVQMLNDIWGFRRPGAFDAALAAARAGVVLSIMHMDRDPLSMQNRPAYADVAAEVIVFLRERVEAFRAAGVASASLVVDPGFGFGKSVAHNLTLLRRLREFQAIGVPVMAGLSRKSTIGTVTGRAVPGERVFGSVAAALIAAQNGATILRVHDVAATGDALRVWAAVRDAN